MLRRSALATLILVLALILPVGVAAQGLPGPTTRHQFRVDSPRAAGPMEMVTFVLDFAPGAATPPHTHPGLTLATILEGELTFRVDGRVDQTYKVGESFVEPSDVVGTAINTGAVKTRVVVSIQVPRGAPPSTAQPGGPTPAPATPTTLYLLRTEASFPGEPYELAHAVLDFGPRAQTPPHTHPGHTIVTVLEGEITHRTGGVERVYRVGESFVEPPRVIGQARNAGTAPASMMATYILPRGAPLSTPVTAPGLPATGVGITAHRSPTLVVALLLGGFLVAGGWGLRRRLDRA